jgi:hypothetical protein
MASKQGLVQGRRITRRRRRPLTGEQEAVDGALSRVAGRAELDDVSGACDDDEKGRCRARSRGRKARGRGAGAARQPSEALPPDGQGEQPRCPTASAGLHRTRSRAGPGSAHRPKSTHRPPSPRHLRGVGHGNGEAEPAGHTAAVVERNAQLPADEPGEAPAGVHVGEVRLLGGSAAALARDEQTSRACDGGDHCRNQQWMHPTSRHPTPHPLREPREATIVSYDASSANVGLRP